MYQKLERWSYRLKYFAESISNIPCLVSDKHFKTFDESAVTEKILHKSVAPKARFLQAFCTNNALIYASACTNQISKSLPATEKKMQ